MLLFEKPFIIIINEENHAGHVPDVNNPKRAARENVKLITCSFTQRPNDFVKAEIPSIFCFELCDTLGPINPKHAVNFSWNPFQA
jgi:hypothetical protein